MTTICDSTPAEDADADLLAAVRDGDRSAFRQLYEKYAGEVLGVCWRVLKDQTDAEDATADVFCEVWEKRERFNEARGKARTYMLLLARSRAIDRLRSRQARPDRPSPWHPAAEPPAASSSSCQAFGNATRNEVSAAIQEALSTLEQGQRNAMELSFFEGLSHQQIAVRLNAPLGTVKSHIRRGLSRLQQSLATLGRE